jgi:glycosyltransferase involved in cell wall biosynthesis
VEAPLQRALRVARRLLGRPAAARDEHPAWEWRPGGGPRVLFVSSAGGAPFRYRVLNQAEQLTIRGIANSYTPLAACHKELVRTCDVVYLYRAHDLRAAEPLLAWAARWGRPVVYDTDDLVWDQRLVEYCFLERHYSPGEVAGFQAMFAQAERLMARADAFVASTPYLATRLKSDFGRPTFTSPNALSRDAVARAEAVRGRHRVGPAGAVTLGYFSGWPKNHEEDFAVAMPALRRLLAEHPEARLRIVGHLDPTTLAGLPMGRVERLPFVPWHQLPEQIAAVDVNLAPLVDNPHRRAKSAIKVLEAALIGVPSVASALDPYAWIEHGRTGMCAAGDDAWYAGLLALVADGELRRALGEAARAEALARNTTDACAAAFAATLGQIAAQAAGPAALH